MSQLSTNAGNSNSKTHQEFSKWRYFHGKSNKGFFKFPAEIRQLLRQLLILAANSKNLYHFRVAVDQIDSLRRQLLTKDEELKRFHKQFEYQEREKMKIVQKLAQVEQEADIKTHELRKIKSQLSDKEDTLDVLRGAKRDIEIRLQKQMTDNSTLKQNLERAKHTQDQLEALQSELVMQESIYDQKMSDIQIQLNQQIDEINSSKESEVESIKGKYAQLFSEKATEMEALRADYESLERKNQQQSRSISDLEFREKELNALLAKKQKCHHLEFDKNFQDLQSEIEFLKELSKQSEMELHSTQRQFAQFQQRIRQKVFNSKSICSEDSGCLQHSSSSTTSQEHSEESQPKTNNFKKKRNSGGKKKVRRQ